MAADLDNDRHLGSHDSIVCFCYRQTVRDLTAAYKHYGSLRALQSATRIGTACGGCRLDLHALFGEDPADINESERLARLGPGCVAAGNKLMSGFIVADGSLESSVHSSNAVAHQLGNHDATAVVSYAVISADGTPIIERRGVLETNATFAFRTIEETLPRPFYGMFLLNYGRGNFGASRFNIQWSNGRSVASTHENATTGRPRTFLPLTVNDGFFAAGNVLYVALMNPHQRLIPFTLTVFDVHGKHKLVWRSVLSPYNSVWIDASERLFGPALERYPGGEFSLKVETMNLKQHAAITVYFFIHNTKSDRWSAQHI